MDRFIIVCRLTSDQHDDYCEDFLGIGIGRHVPKAHGRKTTEGKI